MYQLPIFWVIEITILLGHIQVHYVKMGIIKKLYIEQCNNIYFQFLKLKSKKFRIKIQIKHNLVYLNIFHNKIKNLYIFSDF